MVVMVVGMGVARSRSGRARRVRGSDLPYRHRR
jgi:hypothetical protein